MNGVMVLLIILIFAPPVAAVFILMKRLKEEKYRSQSDARDRFFESISLDNLHTRNDQKPLSEDKNHNTENVDIPVDMINNTEDNKNIIPVAEKVEKTEPVYSNLPKAEPIDQTPVNQNNSGVKNHSSIDKTEAVNLVMDMMKKSKENKNSQVQLQDMRELLKTSKDKK